MLARAAGWGRSAGGRRRGLVLLAICVLAGGLVTAAVELVPSQSGTGGISRAASRPPDALRTGWDPDEPGLSPATVSSSKFGQLFATHVSAAVLGQPLIVGQTVIVATEDDHVYGLDAATGAVRWSSTLGRPVPNSRVVCAVIGATSGVTSSPVYDPRTGRVYLVGEIEDAAGRPEFLMFGVSPQTGAVVWRRPILGSPSNDPGQRFTAAGQLQRPGLLLMNGWVYAAFGPRCEGTLPYGGYVVGVSTSARTLTMWTDDALISNGAAGIWQSGSGLMSDGPGRILLATGDGVSPAPGPGTRTPGQLAESVVELTVQPGGRLVASDFYSPADASTLDAYDLDFGSGGPIGLPFGTRRYPHLLVMAGKVGQLLLLNADHLGGRAGVAHRSDGALGQAGPFGGLYGRVAAFDGGSGSDYIYYVGESDYLRALRLSAGGQHAPVLSDVADSATTFGLSSGSPAVTSNGDNLRSAVIWVVNDSGVSSELEAFKGDPQTVNGTPVIQQIWSAPIGLPSHFAAPAAADGRVYVATQLGEVFGFGVASRAPLSAAPVAFGQVATGSTAHAQVTITARAGVTIFGATTSGTAINNPFTAGPPRRNGAAVQLPVTLSRGQRLIIPVAFAPATAGGASGALSLATSQPQFPDVSVGLSGAGSHPGFYAVADAVQFSNTFPGIPRSAVIDIINGGTTSQAVSSVIPPRAPFSASGLPASGTVLRPGQAMAVRVTFAPSRPGAANSKFTIAAAHGTPVTEFLTGNAIAGDAALNGTPKVTSFGKVPVGHTVTRTIKLGDPGVQPVTIAAVSAPVLPFHITGPLRAGQAIGPTDSLLVRVTFAPRHPGRVRAAFQVRYRPLGSTRYATAVMTLTATAVSRP